MQRYKTLPPVPEKLNGSTVLVRMIDGLGFCYRVATEGLTENEFHFRPVEDSMSIFEVNRHIYQLILWVTKAFNTDLKSNKTLDTFTDYRNATLEICHNLRTIIAAMSEAEIQTKTIYLKRSEQQLPIFNIINGPVADALTHVGQINSWRRMAGNPVAKVSPLTGKAY